MLHPGWTLFIVLLAFGSGGSALNPLQVFLEQFKHVVKAIHNFSYSYLLRNILTFQDDNVVVSPFSAWIGLAAMSEGASGFTRDELLASLGYKPNQEIKSTIFIYKTLPLLIINTSTVAYEFLNTIYYDNNIKFNTEFQNITRVYRVFHKSINFSDASTVTNINNFVDFTTNGRIVDVVQPDDVENAKMVFINGMFFRGQFYIPFDKSKTFIAPFYNEEKDQIGRVNMMNLRAVLPYAYVSTFKAYVLQLRQGTLDRLSLIIIVPRKGEKLISVIKKFTTVPIEDIYDALKQSEENSDTVVDVFLPRFKIESKYVLNDLLYKMGAHDLFDPRYANLSTISPSKGLYLSKFIQKARFEVIEDGVNFPIIQDKNFNNKELSATFEANKPFLYFIADKGTKVVIIGGIYRKPSFY